MRDNRPCPCCGQSAPDDRFTLIGIRNSSLTVKGAGLDRPHILGNGNIVWPEHWSHDDRRVWRAMMDLPGFETSDPPDAGPSHREGDA